MRAIPIDAETRRRRSALLQTAHDLKPKPAALLEQLEAFNTGHWKDFLDGRELVMSAMDWPCPSYIS